MGGGREGEVEGRGEVGGKGGKGRRWREGDEKERGKGRTEIGMQVRLNKA